MLSYLANSKRVDLRWIGEEKKLELKTVLDGLHNGRKVSLPRISKEVGRSYTMIWGLCKSLQIHVRTVAEADTLSAESRTKRKRTPFDGTEEDKAYMIGFTNGDLTAWQVSGTAVMVTSTTTHPAFARLFRELFEKYGPIYEYPMHEKDKAYKWKVATRLDNSFQFLLTEPLAAASELSHDQTLFYAWFAGLLDSDGTIEITDNRGYARVRVVIYNNDLELLTFLKSALEKLSFHFSGPYTAAKRGDTTPLGITYTQDMLNIALQSTPEALGLLRLLSLRHGEKVLRKDVALQVLPAAKWDGLEFVVKQISHAIRDEVKLFVQKAEVQHNERKIAGRQIQDLPLTGREKEV